MADRKWGAITNGATFESLATTIVFFVDQTARLFGRRGKDGGQDARSSDGKLVFQAKHHESASAAAAIRDAKKEAVKIESYRQPSHDRYEQWKGVTHWRLVTNANFNPTDQETWNSEVAPLFAKQGLSVDFWERATLDGFLDKFPEIHRSFFENETRVFLSTSEARERLPAQEPFLRRDELGPFCGRQAELEAVRAFLSSQQLFLVIHGAGGMGKTRLLAEAGELIASEGEWQVLWANVASLASTSSWFEAVVPERRTLLLVDEPTDELVLQQLAEQLGGRVGRTSQWKVAIAVRSPKDPVLRFLRGARMKPRVQELVVPKLPPLDSESMCEELLKTGRLSALPEKERREAARQLSERFSFHPVWLTLAVQHLEDHGNLKKVPADAEALADEYLTEVEQSQKEVAPDSVRSLLQWVALLGTVNREDDGIVKVIGDGSNVGTVTVVRQRLESLIRRRALAERGARNRIVELKPDVLRDHVLRRWLAVDVGGPATVVASDDAKRLLDVVRNAAVVGKLSGLGRTVLLSLARTEFLFRLSGYDLHFLGDLFTALAAAVPQMTASQRLVLSDVLEAVAPFHPRSAAVLAAQMRRSSASDETIEGIFGEKKIGQADVLLSLAWPIFHGAMGADTPEDREAVLRELCAITEAEAELTPTLPRGLPNDGKRAGSLVTRVIEGGPQFVSDYDDTARQLATELVTALSEKPPTLGQIALLKALVGQVLALERRQSWNDAHAFTWRTFAIATESPAWTTRELIISQVKNALMAEDTPLDSRFHLWHLFAEAHRNVNQLCRRSKNDQYFPLLVDDLSWTRRALTERRLSLAELAAAREVWSWHYRFEKEPKLKEAAAELEEIYAANDLAKEFEPLLSRDDWEQKDARFSAKGAELAAIDRPEGISAFVDRAVSFLGSEQELHRLRAIAWFMGEHAAKRSAVRQFAVNCLKDPLVTPRSEFGVTVAVRWIASERLSDNPERAVHLVKDLLEQCGSVDQRANLLLQIYGGIPKPEVIGEFTADEHALLRGSQALFINTWRDVAFVASLAVTARHQWPALQPLLEEALRAIPPERLRAAMHALVDGIYWALRDSVGEPPYGIGEWLLTQLLALPDFDDLGDGEWNLEEIQKRVGKPDARWLPGALARRRKQEVTAAENSKTRAISYQARISKYVRRLEPADIGDAGIRKSVNEMLAFVGDESTVGYYLPNILRDIDPEGLLVPDMVSAKAGSVAANVEDLRRLARIGGAYVVNTPAWRTIALGTIRAAKPHGVDALRSVYGGLSEHGPQSWTGAIGQVAQFFTDAVDEARAALGVETELDLQPFWQNRLTSAEANLRDAEGRAKEERGE